MSTDLFTSTPSSGVADTAPLFAHLETGHQPLPQHPLAPAPGLRAQQRRRIDRVALLVLTSITCAFVAVLVRVGQLQLAPGEGLSPFISDRISRRVEPAPRGDILDRRGRVINATRNGYRLFVDPSELEPPFTPTFEKLASILGTEVDSVAERILEAREVSDRRVADGQSPLRYTNFPAVLTDAQVEAVKEAKLEGVHLERKSVRENPGGDATASIVGKVSLDDVGLNGAEHLFDKAMHASSGYMDYVRDARGRPMWVEANGFATPKRGESVRLSIDLHLQEIAHEELVRGVAECDAAGGRLIMADPNTGEILAMVDHIRDLKGLAPIDEKGKYSTDPDIRYQTIKPDPRRKDHPALGRNRCVEDIYEPGSTFKAFMWSAVTERQKARPDEWIDVHAGTWRTEYGRPIEDVTPRDSLKWSDVLVYSSNIGMVQVTNRLTHQQMRDDVLRFGFGKRTGIGLPGESPGRVTSQKSWSKYTQTSVAMGYEVGVTPLQMVRAFSCFARQGELAGTLPTLTLTSVDRPQQSPEMEFRVLPSGIAELTRRTMTTVAENMARTASRRHAEDSFVAGGMFGKSGTAKIVRPGGKGYFERQYNSSFIAGAPTDDPRLVVLVVMDDPGPAFTTTRRYFGSQVAGPVVLRVMKRSLSYLGVAMPEEEAEESETVAKVD